MKITPYAVLGTLAAAYAALLNTKRGKAFADEHTWLSVVVGVVLVLASLRVTLDRDTWNRVAGSFVVAGLPMIGRSLLNRAGEVE